MKEVTKYVKVVLNIIIPLAGIGLIWFVGPKLLRFFMPFVIGWVIAMIANPLVRFLESKVKIIRKHSSAMIVISVLAAIVIGGYLFLSWLVVEIVGFSKDLPELYAAISLEVKEAFVHFERLFFMLPNGIQDSLINFSENIGEYIKTVLQSIGAPTVEVAGNVAKGIPNALVQVVVTILSSYFFIAERDKVMEVIKKIAPKSMAVYIGYLNKDVKRLVGGYFLAQFRIMMVVAIILAIGFTIAGVNYGLVFAILIALLDFLPVFGTGTALIPWAVVQIFSGEYVLAIWLIGLYVSTQVIRQIIQPKIVGDSLGLPPLVTLLLLYLGYKVNGLSGMIFAVPLGLMVIDFYKYGAFDSLINNIKILIHDINQFRNNKT